MKNAKLFLFDNQIMGFMLLRISGVLDEENYHSIVLPQCYYHSKFTIRAYRCKDSKFFGRQVPEHDNI